MANRDTAVILMTGMMFSYRGRNVKQITIASYLETVRKTDKLPADEMEPILQGLFGEVGGLMAAAKKQKRELHAFTEFNNVVVEELGDILWYLCCLAIRLDVDIESMFFGVVEKFNDSQNNNFNLLLVELGQLAGHFLNAEDVKKDPSKQISSFVGVYVSLVNCLNINYNEIMEKNSSKASGRFIRPDNSDLPTFDSDFEEFERLPERFEIQYIKRAGQQMAMRWNGVFIGDPLADNAVAQDGYRFHDVFHFAHAAILHWSPTFRALIKHKRKSKPEIDQVEDGGRAIVVEEGLTAWVFNIAKENEFFEGRNSLSFDMLKDIEKMTKGFEVEACPLILWEEAVLTGYDVFRQMMKNNSGTVIGSRKNRSLVYKRDE